MRGAPTSPILSDKAGLAWTASCSTISKVVNLRVTMPAIPRLLSFETSLCKPFFKTVNLKKVNPAWRDQGSSPVSEDGLVFVFYRSC